MRKLSNQSLQRTPRAGFAKGIAPSVGHLLVVETRLAGR